MIVQQEGMNVRRKDIEVKEALYHQAKALAAQGLKTEADASRFLSELYLAKENLAITQGTFDKARATLSLYIGETIEENVTLQSHLLRRDAIVLPEKSLLIEQMLQNNTQLQIASQSIHQNELLYNSAKAAHYGSIDAIASYTHQNTLNTYDTSLVGVSITIPLYSGGRISAEAQQARIGTGIAKEQRDSKSLALRDELNTLLIDMKRYALTIEAKQAQLTFAEETREILEARYQEGLSTYIEVLDAMTLCLNAKLGLLETWYNRSTALNRINYLTGTAQ
jgi:outer membrane protein TolC